MATTLQFLEKTTPTITGWFKDLNGNPITIEELKLTVYDSETKEIVNGRNNEDLTGSITSFINGTTGFFTFVCGTSDTAIVRSGAKPGDIVEHVFRFDYKWNSLRRANSNTIVIGIKRADHK